MTQKLRVVIVGLLVSLMSQATFAQYAASTQQVANAELTSTATSKTVRDGICAMNVSKTIMYTGASIAMMGLTAGTMTKVLGVDGDDIDAFVFYTFIGAYIGGWVALTGLPFRWVGKARMRKSGSSLMTISSEGQNGYVTNVEAGWGISNSLSLDVVRGYNFNEHLFVGGGVGCSTFFYPMPGESPFYDAAVPVYANLRLTGGSKRVTPYMSARLGTTLNGFDLYSGIEFGTNIRSAAGSQGESWWLGIKSDCVGLELQTMGLVIGKSF